MWCLQRRTSLRGFRFRASLLFTSPCCWPTANPTDTACPCPCPCPARSVCSLLHSPHLAATAEPRGRDGIPGGLRGAAGRGAASVLHPAASSSAAVPGAGLGVFQPRPQCLQLMELIHSVNSALPPCPHCGQSARRLQAGTATLAPAGSAAKSCSWQGQAEVRSDGRARTG